VSWPGKACEAKIAFTPSADPLPKLGPLLCEPVRHDNCQSPGGNATIGLLAAAPAGASCSMGIVNVVFGAYNTLSASSLDGAGA